MCNLLTLIRLFFACTALVLLSHQLHADNNSLSEYFQARDRYIANFSKAPIDTDEEPALNDIHERLKKVIDTRRFREFGKDWQNNIETFFPEVGFGKLDGLSIQNGNQTLVISNKQLMVRFANGEPEKYPKDIESLKTSDRMLSYALNSNAAATKYGVINGLTPPNRMKLHAYIGVVSQDIGNFPANAVFLILEDNNQIAFVTIEIEAKLPSIPLCDRLWQKIVDTKNGGQANTSYEAEEEAFSQFGHCYGKEFVELPEFSTIKTKAQDLLYKIK